MEEKYPNSHNVDEDSYYEVGKILKQWEDFERYKGSNYVSQCYIQKYTKLLNKLSGKAQGNGLSKADRIMLKEIKNDPDEWLEYVLLKRIKQLKKKVLKHTASWIDEMLYEVYSDLYKNAKRGK